ncbi:CCA tRNA nucleotidyltransferase [Aurantimonas sp. MSK8Z-1]|uniref:CCA tRNA nucleotidyltransferase n=1 Tax=Mangrovibrevibacter kandeliae TaxID=2968473 RepID=UPI00211898AD|nr:CCA tRNA nucleotidyltransferase [Aurantimonas sp. MSK8Z-1]MCW4113782.1 CCA tRNA nucleotidyltransferase [Aurantimonas sp. MSK8Z-1]
MTVRITADWIADPQLQHLLAVLNADGETARIVGGAVRNGLMDRAVSDIDVATTAVPETVIERVTQAGMKPVPTGIAHGTVTVVARGRPFEVTTLRRDVETDGRHARVVFGRDWQADAERRDFTINALYAEPDGTVIDLVGGLADVEARAVRFIGDAETRIREDYLRVLRFFRFFAWYGTGRPDAAGLRAATRLKDGLAQLSVERVWAELRKLLGAPDPSRALLWMRQTGVLTAVLPESERWGIDAIHGLTAAEGLHGWPADPMLRLMAIVPPDAARMDELARRLKLSNGERERLLAWVTAEMPGLGETDLGLRSRLYFGEPQGLVDRLRLGFAAAAAKDPSDAEALGTVAALRRQLTVAERFEPPAFPLSGRDLIAAGAQPGPELGHTLARLERLWVDSGFVLSKERLLEKL